MFNNMLMGAAGESTKATGFAVDNSMLLNDDDSQYLTRTNASATTTGGADAQKKFTISLWWKHGNIPSGGQNLYVQNPNSSNYLKCAIAGSGGNEGALQFFAATTGAFNTGDTSAILRDFHAWYHILFYYDSTDGTAGDRARIYLNGVRLTDFQTSATNPSSGAVTQFGSNNPATIGRNQASNAYSDGYMAEMVVIDGQALTPDNFTETDSNGVLRPLDISAQGFTFGDQGFYLPFTNSAGLGQDYSGTTSTTVVQKNTYNAGSEINEGDSSANPSTGMLFIPPASGTVSKIELNASARGFSGVTVRLETDSGSGQAPSGTLVTNGEVTGITSSGAGLKTATFSTPPEVTAGVKYWIVLRGDTGTWGWQHDVSGVGGALGLYQGALGYFSGRGVGHYVYMNGNHFTPVNSPTQTTDSPTDNRAVITPLDTSASLSKGNLTVNTTTGAGQSGKGSIPCVVGDGNEYVFEAKLLAKSGSANPFIGVADAGSPTLAASQASADYRSYASGSHWLSDGQLDGLNPSHAYGSQEKASSFSSTFTTNDVIGVVVKNSGAVHFYKNGSQVFVSSDQTNISALPAGNWFPSFGQATGGSQTSQWEFRFGDDMSHSYGTAVKLTTAALFEASAPAIEDGSAHFQATLYTGNGGSQSINQSGNSTFKPDLLWTKKRSGSGGHALFDIIRTNSSGQFLRADNTDIEKNEPGFASFDSDGFSWDGAGTEIDVNASSGTFVGWQWLADNTTGSSNTDGSITSTVSVNQTAGFSIVTYTGTGSAATVGHGLGAAPEWILTKKRAGGTVFWAVYHAANTSAPETEYLKLDTTDATADDAGYWNDTAPTSSVFTINNESAVNTSGHNYVAYCWCGKSGFSKFGSYEGNVNANGIFIELGFKPALFIAKNIDATGAWLMFDSAREPFNLMDLPLEADDSKAEAASGGRELDFLSNGVKLRGNSSYLNSAHTFIYMAFAEHPFAGTTPATAR